MNAPYVNVRRKIVPILFRYFMAASRCPGVFISTRRSEGHDAHGGDQGVHDQQSGLRCVSGTECSMCVEAGTTPGCRTEVDRLLASPNTELLRRFRNGCSTFNRSLASSSFPSSSIHRIRRRVVRALTAELRRCLMEEMKRSAATYSTYP